LLKEADFVLYLPAGAMDFWPKEMCEPLLIAVRLPFIRHPYLELLGTMYLYKIRYQESFGRTTGACWRLLFVYGLMPWLHRYRIQTRNRTDVSVAIGTTLIGQSVIAAGLGGGTGPTSFTGPITSQSMDHIYLQQIQELKDEIAGLKQVLEALEEPAAAEQ